MMTSVVHPAAAPAKKFVRAIDVNLLSAEVLASFSMLLYRSYKNNRETLEMIIETILQN